MSRQNGRNIGFPIILICSFIFIMISGVSILAGFFTVLNDANSDKYDKDNPVTAVISELIEYRDGDDIEYEVYLDYEYDGEVYTHIRSNVYTSSMYEGQKLTLYVNPDDPEEFQCKEANESLKIILISVAAIVGAVLVLFATIIIRNILAGKKQKVIHDDVCVTAIVKDIKLMYESTEDNPKYVIYCQYVAPDSGVIYNFEKNNILQESINYIQLGSRVDVVVHNGDFGDYEIHI